MVFFLDDQMRRGDVSFYRWRGGGSLENASSPHGKQQTDIQTAM
jgi:hypothetical protein